MLQFFRTKTRAHSRESVALAVALYAVAGFVIAPKMVRSALLEDIPKTLARSRPRWAKSASIRFLLQVEVKDFALARRGRREAAGVRAVVHRFRAVRFAVAPRLHIRRHRNCRAVRQRDGRAGWNAEPAQAASDLDGLSERPRRRASRCRRFAWRLFKVTQGSVSYEDRSRPTEFAARLQPINFELRDFTTGVEGGLIHVHRILKARRANRVAWAFVGAADRIGRRVSHRGLRAHTIWEYLEDQLNFVINSGSIDLNATYKFSLKDAVDLQVNVSKVALTDLAVRPKDSEIDWITVPGLTLTAATVDLAKRRAHVDSLSLTGVKLLTWLGPDGSFSLLRLWAAPPKPQAEPSAGAPAPLRPPIRRRLQRVRRGSSIYVSSSCATPVFSAEDRSTRPVAKVVLAPLSLQVSGASLDLAKPLSVALDTRINETGSLTVTGDVTPQPAAASLSLKLAGIDLTAIQPYIAQHTSMTLRSGLLGGEAQLRYGPSRQKPALQFAGNIHVENLHTVDNALQDDFINWERLDILGLNYQQAPDRLDIAEVVAHKPYARVIIESDTSLNVKRVLTGPESAAASAPASSAAQPIAASRRGQDGRSRRPTGTDGGAKRGGRIRPSRAPIPCRCRSRKSSYRAARRTSRICRSLRTSPPAFKVSKAACSAYPRSRTRARKWICTAAWVSSRRSRSPVRSMC